MKRLKILVSALLLSALFLSGCQGTSDSVSDSQNKVSLRSQQESSQVESADDTAEQSATAGKDSALTSSQTEDKPESSEQSNEQSKTDQTFENEVTAAEERWQNLNTELEKLRLYWEDHYSHRPCYLFDLNQDGHMEMFVGAPYFPDPNLTEENTICVLENDTVKEYVVGEYVGLRWKSYDIGFIPQKENGIVTGIDYVYFRTQYSPAVGDKSLSFHRFEGFSLQLEKRYIIYEKSNTDQGWDYYIYDTQVSYSEFQSDVKRNYDLIFTKENQFQPNEDTGDNRFLLYESNSGYFDDYLLYESNTRLLTKADLEAMLRRNHCDDDHSKKLYLELARNEIMVRHGVKLENTQELKSYFEKKKWYGNTNGRGIVINELEKANNYLIEAYETELGLDEVSLT